ncbi:MAG: hypothetical protein WCG83_03170 [Candidatus Peregrinibacteria bacterium]
MPNTQPLPTFAPPHLTFAEILRRAAVPFALFAFVLLGLLMLSWLLLLPRFTSIEIKGSLLSPEQAVTAVTQMKEDLKIAEAKREALLLPMDDSVYGGLVRGKIEQTPLPDILSVLRNVAKSTGMEQPNAIMISTMTMNDGVLTISGDVRNVGLKSMTVLAQFAAAVAKLPFTASMQQPTYSRERDPVIGEHSPFSFRISLR